MGNNEAMQRLLNKQNGDSCKHGSDLMAEVREESMLTIKYRDFQLGMKNYVGKTFKVVNGEGRVLFYVYPYEQVQSSLELPENFEESFNEMYNNVESIRRFTDQHTN